MSKSQFALLGWDSVMEAKVHSQRALAWMMSTAVHKGIEYMP